jgi:hypothetical protein
MGPATSRRRAPCELPLVRPCELLPARPCDFRLVRPLRTPAGAPPATASRTTSTQRLLPSIPTLLEVVPVVADVLHYADADHRPSTGLPPNRRPQDKPQQRPRPPPVVTMLVSFTLSSVNSSMRACKMFVVIPVRASFKFSLAN